VLPSSAALISVVLPLGGHPVSGGLTHELKSIARAPIGWSEPVNLVSHNRLWLSRLRMDVEYYRTAATPVFCQEWDMNVTL